MRTTLSLLFSVAAALSQSVSGTVSDAATGAPIRGVKVELLKQTTPFYETVSDPGGRFRFDDLKEGDYSIRYQSPEYWLTAGPTDYRPFHVGPDGVRIDARLMPWSHLSGRVVDPAGRPVPDAPLQLTASGMTINARTYLRTSWGGGGGGVLSESNGRSLPMGGQSGPDGRFEVAIMPGTYTLSVRPPAGFAPAPPDSDGRPRAWKQSWYPGVPTGEAATKIVVSPGTDLTGLELKLLAVPTRSVHGTLAPPAKATVSLFIDGMRPVSVQSQPDGAFDFPAVPEGQWLLASELENNGVKLRATEWIEVAAHDLDNVRLRLEAPVAARAEIVADGPPVRWSPLVLTRRGGPATPAFDPGPMGAAIVDESNSIRDLYPGRYGLGLRLQPPPPPYYLDAIQVGAFDLLTQDVEISGPTSLAVVYKSDGGSVRGTAEGCASGGVLLVPRDPALRRRGFSRSGPCDAAGRYEVSSVRPGDYYALAFAGNSVVVDVDDVLLNGAAKVTVRAREVSTADVPTVTRPIF